jgi:hypothetical protein
MPIHTDDTDVADVNVELAVHNGMTKTVLRIKVRGSLKFSNSSKDKSLTIASSNVPPPFVVPGCATPQSQFTVPKKDKLTVTVSEAYDLDSYFTYTAQIEGSTAEDPIVIIDRR